MTLLEISDHVCDIAGVFDTAKKATCKRFVIRRNQMAYDAHPWNEAQIVESVTAIAEAQSVTLPATVDMVISVRAGTRSLEPVNSTFLAQTDPLIFERSGTPTMYEEWTDTAASNARKLKLFPIPNANIDLLIVGKRKLVNMSADGSSSVLRNIDNCLIAYALGDMQRKLRQWAKADKAYEEAGAMLQAAWALSQDQANKPRIAKNLTVAGNSLSELTDAVCAKVGDWSLDTTILAKQSLRRNYVAVYNKHLWRESRVPATVASDGVNLVLPEYMDRAITVVPASNLGTFDPMDTEAFLSTYPQLLGQTTGTQFGFLTLAPVAVKVLPPGREKLSIVSSSPNDKTPVFVRGESAGAELTETVTLNGTTPVLTVNTYDVPLTIAKTAGTYGNVTIHGFTSTVLLQTLLAAEIEHKHVRLWLQPANTTGQNCFVLGKRRITPLVTDEDTPMLRDIENVLIEMSAADLFAKAGNAAAAQDCRAKAESALQTMIDLEVRQGAAAPRVIPTVESDYCGYGYDNWLSLHR